MTGLRRWLRVFAPFAVGYYLSYLLRTVNAVIAPDLTRELALGAADLGLLTSVYFLAFGAFQLPLGMLLDRYGPRRVEAALLVVCAAGTALFALGGNLFELGLARALIGLGVSACLMASFKSFSQWFAPERQPSLVGAVMMAGALGALTASVPVEMALPLLGWRGIFWAVTALALAVAALILTVPERDHGLAAEPIGAQLAGVARVFRSRDFWRYAPQTCLVVGGFLALQSLWFVPWLMGVEGLSRSEAAQQLFHMNVALLAGYLAIATLSTRLFARGLKPTVVLAAGLGGTIFMGALMAAGLAPVLPALVVMGFAVSVGNLAYPLVSAHFPAQLAGRVNTAVNLLAFAGAFGIQWGFGALVDLMQAAGASQNASFRLALACLLAAQAAAFGWYVWEGRARRPAVQPA